jgi:hypothetical protein
MLTCWSVALVSHKSSESHKTSRIRDRNAAANLAVIRKIAINLVKSDKTQKGSIKGRRKAAGWDNDYMQKIIGF